MNNWKNWLLKKELTPSTIAGHIENIRYVQEWADKTNLHVDTLDYKAIVTYAHDQQKKGLNQQTINNRLNSLSKYYDFLEEYMIRHNNPAKKIRVKQKKRHLYTKTTDYEKLEEIYHWYREFNDFREHKSRLNHARNKVLFGLMVFQAANTLVLKKLETSHVNLDKGTIYLPSTKKCNKRTIPLQSHQILQMHNYLIKIRPQLNIKNEILFDGNLHNRMSYLFRFLKKYYPQLKNADQIRNTVVMHWLKFYNIREVQYFAGHKFISTTEAFQEADVDALQGKLEKFHPWG